MEISSLLPRRSAKLVTSFDLRTEFHHSYFLVLFTSFSVVAAMLLIMAKLSVILRSDFVNTYEFQHSLGKELNVLIILPFKNTFYSAITHLILKISLFKIPTTTTLKLP